MSMYKSLINKKSKKNKKIFCCQFHIPIRKRKKNYKSFFFLRFQSCTQKRQNIKLPKKEFLIKFGINNLTDESVFKQS